MWVHALYEGIIEEQYNSIVNLSTVANSVYYCTVNNCMTWFRNITNEWIQHQACGASQLNSTVPSISSDIQSLTTTHSTIEKAVSSYPLK